MERNSNVLKFNNRKPRRRTPREVNEPLTGLQDRSIREVGISSVGRLAHPSMGGNLSMQNLGSPQMSIVELSAPESDVPISQPANEQISS